MRVGRKSPVRVEAAAPAEEVVQAAGAAVLEEPAAVPGAVAQAEDAGEMEPVQAKSGAKSRKRKK